MEFDALSARVLEGGNDEDILEWAFSHGHKPDAEQIEVWNAFLSKRGWRDPATTGFEKSKAEAGLGDRAEILTFFDVMDAEEGWA